MKRPASVAACALALGTLLSGCAPTVAERSAAVSTPALALSTAPNFRDIGGYRTVDGRMVKPGLAFRSDQMNLLSDADLARIAALRPSAVADLRTATERSREPERVPEGADYLVLDVAADSTESLGGDMRQAMAQIASGQGEALLIAANREFVTLPSARRAYATLIRTMIAADGPVIYHCTAGKDRTGWASAIVLGLLGVPRETVMQDYLLSNDRLAAKNAATLAAVGKSDHAINPAFLEPVLTVRPAYINAAFAEVERVYGTFDAYAAKGLALTPAEIAALKAKFLTAGN